jgi:mortality factor 4-like protein 1
MPETHAAGDKVLCYHGPLIYEAKVLKSEDAKEPHPQTGETGMHYFVHYKGWKNT